MLLKDMTMVRDGEGKRKRGSGGRRGAHFMDAAFDAYARDLALGAWRAVDDHVQLHGRDMNAALQEIGNFFGPYAQLWQGHWRSLLSQQQAAPDASVLGLIESTVRLALIEEQAQRQQRGDEPIEDTPTYKEFISRALGRLFEEASGEIEDLDGE